MPVEQIRISDEWIVELAHDDSSMLDWLVRGFIFSRLERCRVQFYGSDVVIDFYNRRVNEYHGPAVEYRIIERETGRVAFDMTSAPKRVPAIGRFIAHDARTGLVIFGF